MLKSIIILLMLLSFIVTLHFLFTFKIAYFTLTFPSTSVLYSILVNEPKCLSISFVLWGIDFIIYLIVYEIPLYKKNKKQIPNQNK